ncbi:Calyx/polyhedron envelope protein [Trabala vishnou gigantina nucleopolyhedrovirus]|uniref:Calyx/polyhedron envelope protein n=1 Tax=Trabala vishnou gigantina nucleopolyhedrovirus TaxID=2863583 RepID=UPI002481A4D7|nr:Calyx/polyhedron envelope protein [Trabala vishnou gigantina nucleopolyhedrovirus]QYC92705.1 Calyx/polyhedron envelope protein [Trabala vishnou gigantina nucleopolyhedrovirus]
MSSPTVLTKKCHDVPLTAFLDHSWVLWVGADDVLQVLRLPVSTLQSIPLRHKKCWNDFRSNSVCRLDGSKLFIDNYGLGNLCNRVNSNQADYLCTLFVAEIYLEACAQSSQPIPPVMPFPPPPPPPDCRPLPPPPPPDNQNGCGPHHHHHNDRELLERIQRQNDLIVHSLNQFCINNSNQHLEIINILNSIKLQNVTVSGQLTQLIDLLENQVANISADIKTLLGNLDDRLDALLNAVNKALAQLQESVRNELTNINSILNNIISSITNINATLNNLLQVINGLDLGAVNNLTAQINTILETVQEVLKILTPDVPLNKKA